MSSVVQTIDRNPIVSHETSLTAICSVKQELFASFEQYEKVYGEFRTYLNNMRTEQSNNELETLALNDTRFKDQVFSFLHTLEEHYVLKLESRLHKSVSSKSDKRSDTKSSVSRPSVVAQKQAKTEAARIKVSFAEQEATLKLQISQLEEEEKKAAASADRQKADLEIKLQLLRNRKDAAAAEAEAEALSGSSYRSQKLTSIPEASAKLRTAEDIMTHTPGAHVLNPSAPVFESITVTEPKSTYYGPYHSTPMPQTVKTEIPQPQEPPKTGIPQSQVSPLTLEPPKIETVQPHVPVKPQEPQITDFTNFLLKKELLLSRLNKFSDRPENYRVWKMSFKG